MHTLLQMNVQANAHVRDSRRGTGRVHSYHHMHVYIHMSYVPDEYIHTGGTPARLSRHDGTLRPSLVLQCVCAKRGVLLSAAKRLCVCARARARANSCEYVWLF